MSKKILYGEDAKKALKRGIDAVADAVKVTIGPRGMNVAYEKSYGGPVITNDGVSIAKEITLRDKFENMGAEIIKEVASKTNDVAGDGTTTSVVLAQAIITDGLKRTAMGANGLAVRHGIEKATEDVLAALRSLSKPVKGKEDIRQVATISAESEEIGRIIADTIDKVGKDGVVTVEESQVFGVESEVTQGIEFDKGYVSPYLITNTERMEAQYADVPIFMTDRKISAIKDILPLLEKLAATGKKELVIIADDVDGEALSTFIVNKLRGGFSVLAVKAPGYGDRKKEMMEDIAVTIGATVITEDFGLKLESVELSHLGKARRVIATKDSTTIVGGKGKKADVEDRVSQLKAQLENTTSKYDKEKIVERIAKLAGGVAVIRVGAATETEMKYLKLKIEDAVNATKAAIEEGIVPGGGVALVKAAGKVANKVKKEALTGFDAGYAALVNSLRAPMRQILENVGYADSAAIVIDQVMHGTAAIGYDALKDEIVADVWKAGIIDPVKVTRTALQNAASAAGILLTTEVAIAEEPKDEKPAGGGMEY